MIIFKNEYVIPTSMVGTILNGLSHLHGITDKAHFAIGLIRGFGGNMSQSMLNEFAKVILKMVGESEQGEGYLMTYDIRAQCIRTYSNQVNTDLDLGIFQI